MIYFSHGEIFCISKNCVNACGRKLTREIEKEAQAFASSQPGETGAHIRGAYLCEEANGNK